MTKPFEYEVVKMFGLSRSSTLEFKPVLSTSKNIALDICSFANSEGGFIIVGVSDTLGVIGLSSEFYANDITHKALDLLEPRPNVSFGYVFSEGKQVFALKVERSESQVSLEGKIYVRQGTSNLLINPPQVRFKSGVYPKIQTINQQLEGYKKSATESKIKLISHYQTILKLFDDLSHILHPLSPSKPTTNLEGKVLSRILFSSFVDNFESYLSDLLYEIFLSNPSTLKSKQPVTIEEVLDCSDLQEFIKYWAKQKLAKLQKGSVKGFITENKQISALQVIDIARQEQIEKILQIRHLYSHRNGIVDERFLSKVPGQYSLNTEHQLSIEETCNHLVYLAVIVDEVDLMAIKKYSLTTSI